MTPYQQQVQRFVEDVPELADAVRISADGRVAMSVEASKAFAHWRDTHRTPERQGERDGQ